MPQAKHPDPKAHHPPPRGRAQSTINQEGNCHPQLARASKSMRENNAHRGQQANERIHTVQHRPKTAPRAASAPGNTDELVLAYAYRSPFKSTPRGMPTCKRPPLNNIRANHSPPCGLQPAPPGKCRLDAHHAHGSPTKLTITPRRK